MTEQETTVQDVSNAAIDLSRAAIRDPEVMKMWNEVFPGVCPACMTPHRGVIKKGLCVRCLLIKGKAEKSIARDNQE